MIIRDMPKKPVLSLKAQMQLGEYIHNVILPRLTDEEFYSLIKKDEMMPPTGRS